MFFTLTKNVVPIAAKVASASSPETLMVASFSIFLFLCYFSSKKPRSCSLDVLNSNWSDDSAKTKFLSQEHLEPIARRRWKSVLSWVAFHPDQVARLRDTKGQTVLHHAALFRAPEHIMESILWVAPELASVPNKEGELALHWAVRLSTSTPVLTLLLRANPETAFWKDQQQSTPLSLVWERHQTSLLQNWRSEKDKLLEETNTTWKRILSFFRATHEAATIASTPSIFLPVHIAACRPCPPSLFPFMVELYKDDLSKLDGGGRSPLAIACQFPISNRSCDVLTKIQILVRAYPAAARYKHVLNGRYPLHVALASRILWNDGIKALLDTFPLSISAVDASTGLFPFAVAAIGKISCSKSVDFLSEENASDPDWLTLIYSILREDPSVLKLSGF